MRRTILCSLTLAMFGLAHARGEDPRARSIAPFLDADVLAVGHLDLAKVDADKLIHRLIADRAQADPISGAIAPWLAALRQAGAKEVYMVFGTSSLTGPAAPSIVVPLAAGSDAKVIGDLLCGRGPVRGPVWPVCATIHDAVMAGDEAQLDRARRRAMVRPELTSALEALGNTSAEVVLIPTVDARRVVEELLPSLPAELGGGPVTDLTRGMPWAAIGLTDTPQPRLQLIAQGKDAGAVQALDRLGKNMLSYIRRSPLVSENIPGIAQILDGLQPVVNEDRISVSVEAEKAHQLAQSILIPLRQKAARTQCIDNLKQIGLAMHNYHDKNSTFPPAYSADAGGKPLLSWRVLILPYLEQEKLYKEFHLNEPWDSPHNRALMDRIPDVYRCPGIGLKSLDSKTTYLAPIGKSTVFQGPNGTSISSITDGTSNTVLLVDAPEGLAVPWTKPDDLRVGSPVDPKGIFGRHPGGTEFLLGDGSVRFFSATTTGTFLDKLFTRDGGEVVDWEKQQ